MARLNFSVSLENFKILNFFNLWALRALIFKRVFTNLASGRGGWERDVGEGLGNGLGNGLGRGWGRLGEWLGWAWLSRIQEPRLKQTFLGKLAL